MACFARLLKIFSIKEKKMFLLDLRALRAAQRAAELVGKISESLILVRLFDEIRTFFERN